MPGFWDRLLKRRRDDVIRREAEEKQMSKAERRRVEESVDDFQADEFVEEHLGGIDPNRLLGDDKPPRDYPRD
jgi:hypothetical protein